MAEEGEEMFRRILRFFFTLGCSELPGPQPFSMAEAGIDTSVGDTGIGGYIPWGRGRSTTYPNPYRPAFPEDEIKERA